MKFHNDFIGVDCNNTVLSFLPGDTEELYNRHYLRKGSSWYYRDLEISYSLNENGHRCKSIAEINLNNYVLFVGCSHTMGIGLELEKTYPYIVAQKLGFDYYNLAMPGAGIDVLEYNLLTWFSNISLKPKFVFIQMPDHTRFASYNPFIAKDILVESGTWAEEKSTQEMLINSEDVGFLNAKKYFIYKNIEHILRGTPLLKYNVAGQSNPELGIKMRKYDLARDMSHFGIKSHQIFAEDLSKLIVDMHPSLVTV